HMLQYLRALAILVAILLALMTYILTQYQELSAAAALSPITTALGIAASTQTAVSAQATAPGAGDAAPLPQGVYVAGIEVGGMRPSAAQARLAAALTPLLHPLDLRVATARATLRPEDIGMHIPLDALIAEAQSAPAGARIALRVSYDAARLQSVLEDLA